jgi:hypothetical protein
MKGEEIQCLKNELSRVQQEIEATSYKNVELEQIMKEEGENYRKHDNDSKETLIAIHKKWATFSRETLTLAKSVHAMAESLAMTKDHKMALDNYFRQLDDYEQFLNMSIEDLKILERKRQVSFLFSEKKLE